MKLPVFAFARSYRLFFFGVVCLALLPGCGGMRYESDYKGFNAAYADSSNRQMLLNLARLDQHDPTYFLQFGQISVQYNFSGSINGGVNNTVPQSTLHVPVLTETGTLAAGGSTTPSFTFIPVSDDKVAQELLQPVPANVVYTLFQQGWPVDQLLRLMVERFEIQLPGQTQVTTYSNNPARDSRSYATFLKICAIAREFQRDGDLKLVADQKFVPLANGWTSETAPAAKDLLDAQDKHLIYQKDADGKWELGSTELMPRFILGQDGSTTVKRLRGTAVYEEGSSLENMRALLAQGFSVEGDFTDKQDSSPRLVLRSFLSILAAAAQEQTAFAAALEHTQLIQHIPKSECRPILQLRWPVGSTPLMDPLIALDYHGQSYQITDPVSGKIDEAASWNRDVFRLLTQLASQVSVDISKFPLPTIIQ